MENHDYWQKQEKPLFPDLEWNLPEQKTGKILVVGGNSQNFSTTVRISEFLSQNFNLEEVRTLLPDSLHGKIPSLPNFTFAPSTDSGSFRKSSELNSALEFASTPDIFTVIVGDLSKNSATSIAFSEALTSAKTAKILLTRDSVDLITPEAHSFIENENLFFVVSMAQLQKLFRALYYPKVLLLSMPLTPVIEALHKFTLTYKATILTFHQNQILIASAGKVVSTPIEKTAYSPISLWSGQLAAKISAFNLFNPNQKLEATSSAIFFQ